MSIPQEIHPRHLKGLAIVYARQSSVVQLLNNTGSTAYQRDQTEVALAYGWPKSQIKLIDVDLGKSGASSEHRSGFNELMSLVNDAAVGALFITDFSRAARSLVDAAFLIEACRNHNVLIIVDGRAFNPRDARDLLMSHIASVFAEYDNSARTEAMERGRMANIKAGHAISAPPCGYVTSSDGAWEKDPDEHVRLAVEFVFKTFLAERTLSRTVRAMNAHGQYLPRRRGAKVRWVPPQIGTLCPILKNPAYMGDYFYRRRIKEQALGRDARGHWRSRRATSDETRTIPQHHAPYVSAAEWREIQEILANNCNTKERRNPGPGDALLQGILRCGLHRHRVMTTVAKARSKGRPLYCYYCQGSYDHGGPQCGRISAATIDDFILNEIVSHLAPPTIEEIREGWRRETLDASSEERRHRMNLRKFRDEVERLDHLYQQAAREMPRVRNKIGADYEEALQRLDEAEKGSGWRVKIARGIHRTTIRRGCCPRIQYRRALASTDHNRA